MWIDNTKTYIQQHRKKYTFRNRYRVIKTGQTCKTLRKKLIKCLQLKKNKQSLTLTAKTCVIVELLHVRERGRPSTVGENHNQDMIITSKKKKVNRRLFVL